MDFPNRVVMIGYVAGLNPSALVFYAQFIWNLQLKSLVLAQNFLDCSQGGLLLVYMY